MSQYGGVYRPQPWTTWTRPVFPPYTFVYPPIPPIVSRHPRVLPPARRGRVAFFPLVGAPGNAGYQTAWIPPIAAPRRAAPKPFRRGLYFFAPYTGLSLEQAKPPDWIRPANWRRTFALARRGKSFFAPFNGLSLEKDVVPTFKSRPANRSPLPTRRGKYFFAPFTGLSLEQLPPVAFIRQSKRQIFTLARRGRVIPPYMVGFAPGQRDTPPFIRSRASRVLPPARRGIVFDFVLYGRQPGEIDAPDRIKSRYTRVVPPARRGQFQARVDAIVVAPPGTQALPPDWIRPANRRRTFALARRGHEATFPLVGSGLGYQTAWIPPIPSRRTPRVSTPARRGQYFDFNVTPTQQPLVPPFISRRRPLALRRGAGDYQIVPLVDQSVVSFRGRRRAQGVRVLQRHSFQPVPSTPDVPRRVITPARHTINIRTRRGVFRSVPSAATARAVGSSFFPFFG